MNVLIHCLVITNRTLLYIMCTAVAHTVIHNEYLLPMHSSCGYAYLTPVPVLDLRGLMFDLPWFVLLQSFIDHLEPMHAHLDELKVYLGEGEKRRGQETGRTEKGGGRRRREEEEGGEGGGRRRRREEEEEGGGRQGEGIEREEEEIALLYLEAANKLQRVSFIHAYMYVYVPGLAVA